ncbi:MAG: cytochrome b pre-mRNA-processing protein 3 [Sphingomonadales bacterium]|nr:cytochrome b pre-mRNA-processing protein 3 [Sphingomonadales bacterium]
MLGFLFRTLTADPARGAALFAALTGEARKPHWYVEGAVPDTLDGRFAMLATVMALANVRLEQLGDEGNAASVALTERFIEVMESEHREMGLGDPKLGRTVRKLVGSLARRVALWRGATAGEREWSEAARESCYGDAAPAEALDYSAAALRRLWTALAAAGLGALVEGRIA